MSHVFTSALLDRFRAHLIDEERSSATIAKYLHDVGAFFAFAGDVPIDKELVLRWKHALPERCKITTANAALSALNHFFKVLGWTDCVVRPFKYQRESFRDQRRELTRDEYLRLIETAQRRNQT